MNKIELITKLNSLLCSDLPVLVRGENVIANISDVCIDSDHSDDSYFISLDLELSLIHI